MSPWRYRVLLGGFFIFGLLLVGRLFYWQIIYSENLQARAESQHFIEQELRAPRGQILTADGFPIASTKKTYLLYAALPQLDLEVGETAARLKTVFDEAEIVLEEGEIKEKLSRSDLVWVPIARRITRETKAKIEALGISGLGFEEEEQRFYPEGSMSAHLLGFVGQDSSGRDKGYFGLEGFYDRSLSGRPGRLKQEKDAQGKPILMGESIYDKPLPGMNLELFLDRGLQFMVEEKLKKGLAAYGAVAGSVVIMDPGSGGVLAMASFPSYDPINYPVADNLLFPNPVVNNNFEPGSVLKVLVMAAALDEEVVELQDKCPCGGPVTIGEYTIRTWDDQYYPDSTMTEVIQHSDNVGMVYVAQKMGKEKFLGSLGRFGIGENTGIDLEEEASRPLRPVEEWTPIDLATVSFGQGVAVTPIQLVRAVAAIANGGKLLEPHMVSVMSDQERKISIKPKLVREVIKPTTAKVMTEVMINAVENGEAKWAKPKGYRIAGKTGTAQIPIAGHYDEEKTITSFIGFAPADKPRFAMLVTLQEPTSSPWGSETAAPLWFSLASEIFTYWGIQPS